MLLDIVIPVYNEEKALPKTLDTLLALPLDQIGRIIVVDGNSIDRSCQIVKDYQRYSQRITLLHSPIRGRGTQMNIGARYAQSPWLLFLHADTLIGSDAMQQLLETIQQDSHCAGAFKHRFSGRQLRLKGISWLHNWRFEKTRIIYGDQAMFVKGTLFHSLGGFPEVQMEDIQFSERLLERTEPVMLDAEVVTDSRKFEQIGITRAFIWVIMIILSYEHKRAIPFQRFFAAFR